MCICVCVFPCVCTFPCVCKVVLHWQWEWACIFGGLHAQVPAAGETRDPVAATGLTESLRPSTGGIHTMYLSAYTFSTNGSSF